MNFSSDCRPRRLRRGLVALKHPANMRHRARVLAQARAERIATNGSPDGHLHGARATAPWPAPACCAKIVCHTMHTAHTETQLPPKTKPKREHALPLSTQQTPQHKKRPARSRRTSAAMHCTHSLARSLACCTALHGTRTAPTRPRPLRGRHPRIEPAATRTKTIARCHSTTHVAQLPSGASYTLSLIHI